MNKKEKERYEQLGNMNMNINRKLGSNSVAASSEIDNLHFKSLKKGKFMLDPLNKGYPKSNINGNSNNKLEFSIKATLEFGDQGNPHLIGNRKPKIKLLGPIQERNKDEDLNDYAAY